MPYTTPALNAALAGIAALGTRISLHSSDPGTTGAGEVPGTGRPATTWSGATSATLTGTAVTASVPAATTITHWGIFSSASGGTFLGGFPLTTAETYRGAAGTLTLTPTLTATNLA